MLPVTQREILNLTPHLTPQVSCKNVQKVVVGWPRAQVTRGLSCQGRGASPRVSGKRGCDALRVEVGGKLLFLKQEASVCRAGEAEGVSVRSVGGDRMMDGERVSRQP